MAKLIGISGPSCTGKTEICNIIKMLNLKDVYVTNDVKDDVWNKMVNETSFSQWEEVYNDKDYLLLYCYRMVSEYKDLLRKLKSREDVKYCIIDTTYIDLLIYTQLQFWYHYPSAELLSSIVSDILSLQDKLDIIYMTEADDEIFEHKDKDLRQKMTDFKRNRGLELSFYSIYRNLPTVKTVDINAIEAANFITKDLGVN